MKRDVEDQAAAFWAGQTHGVYAPVWIAARIGELALAGDMAGVAQWRAIAAAWQDLQQGSAQ